MDKIPSMAMTSQTRPFLSSKILLFGEYSIVLGSQGLAVPFPEFGGKLAFPKGKTRNRKEKESNACLKSLFQHLEQLFPGEELPGFELEKMHIELENGLYFESNIPQGYGLGSSGALCAAVYEAYFEKNAFIPNDKNILELRDLFAKMESHFHGTSSGLDPLISHLGKPVLMKRGGAFESVELPPKNEVSIFLLDTKLPRKTAPLVQYFLEKCKKESFKKHCENELTYFNENAIGAFLKNDHSFLKWSAKISAFQLEHFANMIPAAYRGLWKQGLECGDFCLKLCGAGGGGFLLGFANDFEEAKEVLAKHHLLPVNLVPAQFRPDKKPG